MVILNHSNNENFNFQDKYLIINDKSNSIKNVKKYSTQAPPGDGDGDGDRAGGETPNDNNGPGDNKKPG